MKQKFKYTPEEKKRMKRLLNVTDADIKDKEKWNEELYYGRKTLFDYMASELSTKFSNVFLPFKP